MERQFLCDVWRLISPVDEQYKEGICRNHLPSSALTRFCPVCGHCEGKDALQAVEGVKAAGTGLKGDLVAFMVETADGGRILSIAFESKGKPVPPKGKIAVGVPVGLCEGYTLTPVGPDGAETDAVTESDESGLTVRLDCTGWDDPALLFRLIPNG